MDGLTRLRRRLFDLVAWFGADGGRLPAAQGLWRARTAALWDRAVEVEADRLLAAVDDPPAAAPLDDATRPDDALRALEATDLAGSLWAGTAYGAPSQAFGDGAAARYVIRLGRERRPRTARQAGVLYTHLRFHALVPTEVSVASRPAPFRVRVQLCDRGFDGVLARAALGVATTSFDDGAAIEWRGERAIAVRGGDDRGARLWGAVEAAARAGADVLVAPELTVTPGARDAMIRRLRWADGDAPARPALVVPGSFHEQVGDRFVHRAVLLDGATGNRVLEHDKLAAYGALDAFVEDIALGTSITLLVTPIGTIAIAICKDFCDDHVGAIWQQLQPEWLLVPAYGAGASAHELAAARIARMVGTVTVLAHQGDAAQGAPFRSFVQDAGACQAGHNSAPEVMTRKIPI